MDPSPPCSTPQWWRNRSTTFHAPGTPDLRSRFHAHDLQRDLHRPRKGGCRSIRQGGLTTAPTTGTGSPRSATAVAPGCPSVPAESSESAHVKLCDATLRVHPTSRAESCGPRLHNGVRK